MISRMSQPASAHDAGSWSVMVNEPLPKEIAAIRYYACVVSRSAFGRQAMGQAVIKNAKVSVLPSQKDV
jgi:hypothetical protein